MISYCSILYHITSFYIVTVSLKYPEDTTARAVALQSECLELAPNETLAVMGNAAPGGPRFGVVTRSGRDKGGQH